MSLPLGTLLGMTAAAAQIPEPDPHRPPFADATPAQVRAALVPEDVAEFDQQWRDAMGTATETLDLADVHRTLESWRRVAWLTSAHGQDGYRRLMATAAERSRTGAPNPEGVSLEQVKALISERLSELR